MERESKSLASDTTGVGCERVVERFAALEIPKSDPVVDVVNTRFGVESARIAGPGYRLCKICKSEGSKVWENSRSQRSRLVSRNAKQW